MLNGNGNENGIKINRCNQQKNKFASAAHFFFLIIQQKNKFVRAAPFLFNQQKGKVARAARLFFAVVLHDQTTVPFCTTKTSNLLVNQTLFLWRNCLCAYHKFCFLCSCYVFTVLIFTLLAASISHFFTASMKFSCFLFQRNSSPWCSFTRSSSFSVIHMSVHIKNNVEKNTTFFFSKSLGHSKLNLELHLDYYTC